jgi:GNAT superfamily N-acetyltransferase
MAQTNGPSVERGRTPIAVRVASAADAAALARISKALSGETIGSNPAHAMDEQSYRAFIGSPDNGFCLIAQRRDDSVAGLLVQFDAAQGRSPRWWIHNAYVVPEWRARGVFSRMYDEVAIRARAAGVGLVRVSVMSENASARDAYARLGFNDVTESIARERVNSITDPAVYTQLGLTQPPFRVLEATLED